MAFLGSSRWFDAAIVAVAALIFLGAQSRFMDLAQYLAIAFVVAAVVRAAAGRVGGIAPATLLAVALVAAVGGLPWRFAFNVSSTCLEATAESAPTGPSRSPSLEAECRQPDTFTDVRDARSVWPAQLRSEDQVNDREHPSTALRTWLSEEFKRPATRNSNVRIGEVQSVDLLGTEPLDVVVLVRCSVDDVAGPPSNSPELDSEIGLW
jgi:hypothetical protein